MDRRGALAGFAAFLATPATAALAPADRRIKASPIRWPAADGGTLHGFMAIPARAKGKQPAVLVLAGPDGAAGVGAELAAAVAQAGMIACSPDPAMIAATRTAAPTRAFADLDATIGWLGHHDYASGAVGLLGTAGTASLLLRLAANPAVTAAVLLDPVERLTETRTKATLLTLAVADSTAWAAAWPRAMTFLREHLQ